MNRSRRKAGNAAASKNKESVAFAVLDTFTRIALGLWFAFASGMYFRNAYLHWYTIDGPNAWLVHTADAVSIAAIGLFSLFIACLYAVRLQPINKFSGAIPAVTSVLGAFFNWALLLLKMHADWPPSIKILIAALILTGNIYGIITLRHLGRSFSIFPEGRRLVTTGPYRYVRHPLYIAEGIAALGAMISFWSPAAVAIILVQFVLQFIRMGYEEKVLRQTFPEYAAYARRTARLIPGLY